jgi:hypothetical protein
MILLNNCDLLPSISLYVLRIAQYRFQHTCLELFFQYSIQSCAEAVSSANTALHPAVIKAAHSTSNCRVTATLQEIWATATLHDQGPSLHGLESSMIPTAQDAHGAPDRGRALISELKVERP